MSGLALSVSQWGPFLEGSPGQVLIVSEADVTAVLETCFSSRVGRVLLYSANLTPTFFDLSSREAGIILQRFRNYGIRLAVVCATDLQAGRRFAELVAEENRGRHVRFFAESDRKGAVDWLCGS